MTHHHTTDTQRGADGGGYTFVTPCDSYELNIEERPTDPFDRFCVSATSPSGYDEWSSDGDLRGAIGVAVMRIIRHETGDNCLCRACRDSAERGADGA